MNEAIEAIEKFHVQFLNEWGQPKDRTIGHMRYSPTVATNVGPEGFTEDWGVVELKPS